MDHVFEDTSFSALTRCFVCRELIANDVLDGLWNPVKGWVPGSKAVEENLPKGKGSACVNCGLSVHKRCVPLVTTLNATCAFVQHEFKIRSYTPFSTMCDACGTTLEGLYRQGYRCTLCGIDVHSTCRTNPNIHVCEAKDDSAAAAKKAKRGGGVAPEPLGVKSKNNNVAHGKVVEEVEEENVAMRHLEVDEEPSDQARREEKLKKLKVASEAYAKNFEGKSIEYLGIELRKFHAQSRALSVNKVEEWENTSRVKLRNYKKQLKAIHKSVTKATERNSVILKKQIRARNKHYVSFLKSLKVFDADKIEGLMAQYSGVECREKEMLEMFINDKLVTQKDGLKRIQKELNNGLFKKEALENTLEESKRLELDAFIVNSSLQQVNRELYFPRYKNWFARLSIDNRYVAISTLWLERASGSLAIKCSMIPHKKKENTMVPTIVILLSSTEEEMDLDSLGRPGGSAAKHNGGASLVAHVESLSVTGGKLPLHLENVSLDLEYYLKIEMHFVDPAETKNGVGYWQLNTSSFKFKFLKFGLKFKNIGQVNVPDTMLRSILRSLVISGVKQTAKTIVPPELGQHLHNMYKQQKQGVKSFGDPVDQFRFYARMDVKAEIGLETLNFNFAKGISENKKIQNRLKKLAGKKEPASKDKLVTICRSLGLDMAQLDLLLRTQLALGMTKDSVFPDDSLKALGMKALNALNFTGAIESADASLINLDGMLEAAQKIGQKAFAGEFTNSQVEKNAPLYSLYEFVKYVTTYFALGQDSAGDVFSARMVSLWQSALDKTAQTMGLERTQSNHSLTSQLTARSTVLSRTFSNSSNLFSQQLRKRISFPRLIERIHKLNQKRVISSIEVLDFDVKVGLFGISSVIERRLLDYNSKRKGGSALLFELKHSEDDGLSVADNDEEEIRVFDVDDEGNPLPSRRRSSVGPLDEITSAEEKATLAILRQASNTDLQAQKLQKQKEIISQFKEINEMVDYVKVHVLNKVDLNAEVKAGTGIGELAVEGVEVVSVMDFTGFINAGVWSHRKKYPNWPWRRLVRSNNGGLEMVTVQVIQKRSKAHPERVTDPESEEALRVFVSPLHSELQYNTPSRKTTSTNSNTILTMDIRPSSQVKNASDWSSPGKLIVNLNSQGITQRVTMEKLQLSGGLEMLHSYLNDLIPYMTQSLEQRQVRLLKLVVKKVMKYALLNTFIGSLGGRVQFEVDEHDAYVRISNGDKTEKAAFALEVEHDFVGFTDDVAHLLRVFRMDDINLDTKEK